MQRDRRVGLLCQHYYPELISTGMHMTELGSRLSTLGWDVTVVCGQPTLDLDGGNERVSLRTEHEGVDIHRVRALGSHRGLFARVLNAATFALGTLIKAFRLSRQVDGFLITTNPPFLGVVGALVRRLRKAPYVLLVYDVYPDLAGRLGVVKAGGLLYRMWDALTRLALRHADRIVVIGDDMRELVLAKVPEKSQSMEVVRNWSDESHVAPVPPEGNSFRRRFTGDSAFVVQYAGRMARTHNIEPLVDAAPLLASHGVVFQFIGDGAKRASLQAQAVGMENVQFLPYQPRSQLAEVLSAPDLAVVCLGSEFTGVSVPSKAYGIMAAGTPLLGFVAEESEIGRMIREHDCGFVLEDPDPAAVAGIVRQLLEDPDETVRLGRNARRAFEEHFTLSVAASHYDRILDDAFL